MTRKTVHTIYGLYDPEDTTQEIRYVGYTHFSPEQRIIEHVAGAKKAATTHKQKWIRKLLRKGTRPAYKILEVTTAKDWKQRERYWIAALQEHGQRLTNSTEGGDGLVNPSKDVRRRISKKVSAGLIGNQRRTGKKGSPEFCERHSKTLRASKKFKVAQAKWRGIPRYTPTAATKAKISKLKVGIPRPDMVGFGQEQAEKNRGSFWVNDGIENKLMRPDQDTPKGFVRGRLMNRQMTTKHRRYVTNGEENKMIGRADSIPNGFRLGQTKINPWTDGLRAQVGSKMRDLKLGYRWIRRGQRQRQLTKNEPLPTGWRFIKVG
jgi:GIY-YIG catalytic domain